MIPNSIRCMIPNSIRCMIPDSIQCMIPDSIQCMIPNSIQCMKPNSIQCMIPNSIQCMIPNSIQCMIPDTWTSRSEKKKPFSLFSPTKKDCKRCFLCSTTQSTTWRSLLPECHTVWRYTRKYNFIYTFQKSTACLGRFSRNSGFSIISRAGILHRILPKSNNKKLIYVPPQSIVFTTPIFVKLIVAKYNCVDISYTEL
jgi:hypothetical protein